MHKIHVSYKLPGASEDEWMNDRTCDSTNDSKKVVDSVKRTVYRSGGINSTQLSF